MAIKEVDSCLREDCSICPNRPYLATIHFISQSAWSVSNHFIVKLFHLTRKEPASFKREIKLHFYGTRWSWFLRRTFQNLLVRVEVYWFLRFALGILVWKLTECVRFDSIRQVWIRNTFIVFQLFFSSSPLSAKWRHTWLEFNLIRRGFRSECWRVRCSPCLVRHLIGRI